jgi:hypothetical protein
MSLTIQKMNKGKVQYSGTELKPVKFLQPPEPVTTVHNAIKGNGTTKPTWHVIERGTSQILALNKGSKYTVILDDADAMVVDASKGFQTVDISGFESLVVDVLE